MIEHDSKTAAVATSLEPGLLFNLRVIMVVVVQQVVVLGVCVSIEYHTVCLQYPNNWGVHVISFPVNTSSLLFVVGADSLQQCRDKTRM